MKEITISDKRFRELIPGDVVTKRIDELAGRINKDYSGKEILFLGILNGAFMFAAELVKRVSVSSRISFVKIASYNGMKATGDIKKLIGLNEEIKGKEVIIIEDVVDTGNTLDILSKDLLSRNAVSVRTATLLFKPDSFMYEDKVNLDYIGFEIANNFVVGFGLDYNGFGRNLQSIYTLI